LKTDLLVSGHRPEAGGRRGRENLSGDSRALSGEAVASLIGSFAGGFAARRLESRR
jgi:hypothetical protein